MNNVSKLKLSLRKLVIAALAVGPLAVLPSPVWAAIPTSSSFTATNGTVSLNAAGQIANISATDRAVIVWNAGAFNIGATETYNFILPTGGAVLNKVGYNVDGSAAAVDTATINGTLLSSGKVFILANGSIVVGAGSVINTTGGLVLSTLAESSDGAFITLGDLLYTGASTGSITLGTLDVAGDLTAHAGSFATVGGGSVTGNLVLRSITAASGVVLASAADLSVGGNLTVSANNGSITSGANDIIVGANSGTQTASFTTGGNQAVTLGSANNDFETVAVNAGTGTGGDVTLLDIDDITLAASTVGGNLQVTSTSGLSGKNAIATSGKLDVKGTADFVSNAAAATNSGIDIGHSSTIAGTLTGSVANATFKAALAGNVTAGAISATAGNKSSIELSTTGALNVNGALTATGNGTDGGAISLTGGPIDINSMISSAANTKSTVTLNATSGALTIDATVSGPSIAATTAGGAISQTAAITTSNATGTSSFKAGTGNITLNNAGNAIVAGALQLTGATVAVTNTNTNTVLGTTNVTGNLTLNTGSGNVELGTGASSGSAQNIVVGGILNVTTAAGTITDANYSSFDVAGGLNLTSANGNIILDAASANGSLAPRVSFGAVLANAGTGALTVHETTALNLGNSTAASLNARSITGGIIDSGNLTIAGAATFTVPATDSVTLDSTGHNVNTVNVVGGLDNKLLFDNPVILGNSTSVSTNLTISSRSGDNITLGVAANPITIAGNLTVDAGGTITVAAATTIGGNLSLKSANNGATSISDSAPLSVAGVTTLASAGGIVLDQNNDFTSAVLNNSTGAVTIADINDLTVSGSAGGAVTLTAGAGSLIASTWNLTLGNLTVGSLTATAANGGSGNSGTITQVAGSKIHSNGAAAFTTTNAAITIDNSGNNFGRLSADAGNAAIKLRENSTIKLGTLANSGGGATVTSEFGSIIEDTAVATDYTVTGGTLTLNAANGNIQLGRDTTNLTAGASTAIVANAPTGSVQLFSSAANLALGTIEGSSLKIIHTGAGNLTQTAAAKIFGSANVTSAANIALTNTGNNFGRVSLTANGAAARNVAITEGATLNLGSVTMVASATGNFTATSVNGDIIDTGLANVRPGGTIAAPGTGIVTLLATNGNIVFDDPTTDFATTGGVAFEAKNVTLEPLGGATGSPLTLFLGAGNRTSTADTLHVRTAIGQIGNKGNLTVTGDAVFETANNNISLTDTDNRFGTVTFTGNQVRITQANDINIVTGSTATGNSEFTAGTYIEIADRGGSVTFGGNVIFTAGQTITLSNLQSAGNITVNAAGTKDLSALSLASDLGNKAPLNLGAGAYVAPSP